MKKMLLVISLLTILTFIYSSYSSKVYFDSKVDNVITKFNDKDYELLKGWYGFNRGSAVLWRKQNSNFPKPYYFYHNNQDTNFVEIPISKDFLNDYGLNVEVDTSISERLKIIELNNEILDITYVYEKCKIIFDKGMNSNELFPYKNLINELEEVSLIKKELNVVLIASHIKGDIIKFYLSLDDVLMYLVDGKEIFLKNNPDLKEGFKKGTWINKNWHLSKSKHKLDFG